MDWVLKHLQLLIAVAGAVAWWLKQRRQAQAGEATAPPAEATFADPELAERTRRIREDIQRKIAERSRPRVPPPPGAAKPAPLVSPAVLREAVRRQAEPATLSKAAAAQLEARRTAEILEQQAGLVEQLRQAAERKAATLRRSQFENQASGGEQAAALARGALGDDLRNPDALRRAFILREIIGPPVALR